MKLLKKNFGNALAGGASFENSPVPPPPRMEKVAEFAFLEERGDDCDEVEFVYRASRAEATRRRQDTDVEARWIPINKIPYTYMPADDELWYPLVLRDKRCLSGMFRFDEDKLLDFEIRDVCDGSLVSSHASRVQK